MVIALALVVGFFCVFFAGLLADCWLRLGVVGLVVCGFYVLFDSVLLVVNLNCCDYG